MYRAIVYGSNFGATKQPGEPNHAGNRGGRSVWWRWTEPFGGMVTIDTKASRFDTLLAVYTGTSLRSLQRVTSNNDVASGDRTSSVRFRAEAGRTYFIAVDGFAPGGGSAATGNIQLRLRR
jgi:hypothetical protein